MISEKGELISHREIEFADSMNNKGYRLPSHKRGARFLSAISFPEGMTDSDIGKMVRLSKYMAAGNIISKRVDAGCVPCSIADIQNILNIGNRPCRNFINKMVGMRVIKKKDGEFIISPVYFLLNGQRITLELFLLFREDISKIIPLWAMREFQFDEKENK
jgi:hypothetical protein